MYDKITTADCQEHLVAYFSGFVGISNALTPTRQNLLYLAEKSYTGAGEIWPFSLRVKEVGLLVR